jgi:enoyl-CoA hydratase/carnithine racemase
MTDTVTCTNEYFRCEVDDEIAVIYLYGKAIEINTQVEPCNRYISTLEAIEQSAEISGLIQVNDFTYQDDVVYQQFLEMMHGEGQHSELALTEIWKRYGNIAGRLVNTLNRFSKPMVSGLHGKVTLEYLAAVMPFDFRIATHDTEAIFPNVRLGFPPSGHLAYQLQRIVGPAKATEIFLSGDSLPAPQLLELGMVSKVVDDDSLKQQCIETLRKVCAQPPLALAATRQIMQPDEKDFNRFVENAKNINRLFLARHYQK